MRALFRLTALAVFAALSLGFGPAEAASIGSTGSASSYVAATVKQPVQFFYSYGTGCSSVTPGSVATTATPQYGTVTYATETHVIPAGSPCAGSSLPGIAAYYDWTNTSPQLGTNITAGQPYYQCAAPNQKYITTNPINCDIVFANQTCDPGNSPPYTNCRATFCANGYYDGSIAGAWCGLEYDYRSQHYSYNPLPINLYSTPDAYWNESAPQSCNSDFSNGTNCQSAPAQGPANPPLNQCEALSLKYTATDGTTASTTQSTCAAGKNLGCPQCSLASSPTGGDQVSSDGTDSAGHPISLGTGNMYYTVPDYRTAGQTPLVFTRTYNSQAPGTSLATTLGPNWQSNYDLWLRLTSASTLIAQRADGRLVNFIEVPGTTQWTTDADVALSLTQSGTSWTMTDALGNVETYTTATNGASAYLNSIVLRNGYTRTMGWNAANQLATVTDSYNRVLTLTYSGGLLQTLATPDGETFTYGYTNGQLTSVTYPTSPVTKIQYAYSGVYLTQVTNENNVVQESWAYDAKGRATSNSLGGGIADALTITYNADGSATVRNALGQTETHKFTALIGLPRVTEIDRAATSTTAAGTETFAYDFTAHLSQLTDWNGNITQYQFTDAGLPVLLTQGAGTAQARTTSWTYGSGWPGEPDSITTPNLLINYAYDASGNVSSKTLTDTTSTTAPYSTNGQTRTWQYTWSTTGLLLSVEEPRTDVTALTSYGYDSTGALTSVTNALSQQTKITSHTGGGLPLTIVDPNNVTTTLTYSPRLWLTGSSVATSAGARLTKYGYDAAGNLLIVTQPDNSEIVRTYDHANRVTAVTDTIGNYIDYTLDGLGDVTYEKEYKSGGTQERLHSATYDALGRLLDDTSGQTGTSFVYAYDGNGNVLSVTDPLSHVTKASYDALNRRSTVTDPASNTATTTYDTQDHPLTVTDQAGNVTSFVYDGFGEAIGETSPARGTWKWYYDLDGNLSQSVDGASVTVNRTYDALDRPLTVAYPADMSENVAYTFDQTGTGFSFGIGRLTSLTDAVGSLKRLYDERGNLLAETRVTGGQTLATGYTYDPASRVASITYPSQRVVTYTRDTDGRVTGITTKPTATGASSTVVSAGAYLAMGPLSSLTYGNTIAETDAFDLDYRPTSRTALGGSTTIQSLSWTYDNANNLKTITDAVSAANTQSFTYDPLDRLLTATASATGGYGSYVWTYDKIGNRLSETLGSALTSYTYAGPRLSKVTAGSAVQTFGYTGNGAIAAITPTTGGATNYGYNNAGQLSSASVPGGTSETFTDDAFGRQVLRTGPGGQPVINRYSYDQAGHLLAESVNGSGSSITPVTDYIWLGARPVAAVTASGGAISFLHTDRLNTPVKATSSAEAAVWSATYLPFGKLYTQSGTIAQNLRLPGQVADPSALASWNDNGARTYLPWAGRYLESDPIGLGGGANTYAYALQNPFKYIDPSGLDSEDDDLLKPVTAPDPDKDDPYDPMIQMNGPILREAPQESAQPKETPADIVKSITEPGKCEGPGIVYLRTDLTGSLAPYIGQSKSEDRYVDRQMEHSRDYRDSDFDFNIVDRAQPGTDLDVAEHNIIQKLTGGIPASQSPSVSNQRDPVGPLRRPALGLPEPQSNK